MSVLKLAKKWNFSDLNSRAAENSERYFAAKKSIDKIISGKKFNVEKWTRQGYHEICARPQAITRDEKALLDLPTYVYLLELRDRVTEWVNENDTAISEKKRRGDFNYSTALDEAFSSKEGKITGDGLHENLDGKKEETTTGDSLHETLDDKQEGNPTEDKRDTLDSEKEDEIAWDSMHDGAKSKIALKKAAQKAKMKAKKAS